MSNLNRQPTGLLDFFGIKNGGRYPQVLGETLSPIIDLLPLYEWSSLPTFGVSTGNVAGGVTLFGPAGSSTSVGDSWHFDSVSLQFNCNAAASFAGIRLGKYFQAQAVFVGYTETMYAAQGTAPVVKSLAFQDTWLGPGWSLAFECTELNPVVSFSAAWAATRYGW